MSQQPQNITPEISAAIFDEFNGMNHTQLAIKHRCRLVDVYRIIRQGHLLHLADTDAAQLLARPVAYLCLPAHLQAAVVQRLLAAGATDAAAQLQDLSSTARQSYADGVDLLTVPKSRRQSAIRLLSGALPRLAQALGRFRSWLPSPSVINKFQEPVMPKLIPLILPTSQTSRIPEPNAIDRDQMTCNWCCELIAQEDYRSRYGTIVAAEISAAMTFEQITNQCELVDQMSHYSRYFVGNEETVWVCDDCEQVHADPYEQDCECYDSDAYLPN